MIVICHWLFVIYHLSLVSLVIYRYLTNKQPTTNNQQPTINNQQPTINNQQSTTNN
ncbi:MULTISPECIES: hypothetical protein [Fischerella]|uniref:hypothetical protein n=1 Tax=Fischerella TaxID=1190 RepID=UPI00030499F9|nr:MULTISPECIES: hypothetical protein [Fischerella]MBD2430188.1 hypothetical protein [Fischerella sp. FACHB-380]